MKKLSKEEAIRLHREMWEWIAEQEALNDICINYSNRVDLKIEWLQDHGFVPDTIMNECFLCEYAYQQSNVDRRKLCRYCPLIWTGSQTEHYMCEDGECDWRRSDANEIAHLAEKGL